MHIQAIWSVVMFIVFLGIILWAFSPKRTKDFDEAADIPLEEDINAAKINAAKQND